MGTDITMMVEGRMSGKEWIPLVGRDMWPNEEERKLGRTPLLLRNYELFSILADVRNRTGRGFKTMRTFTDPKSGKTIEFPYDTDDGGHDPLVPISVPKGIPADGCSLWTHWLDQNPKFQFHDHSFLTLEELLTGQWDQHVYRDAILSEDDYKHLIEDDVKPTQLARGAGGDGVRVVNEVEYAAGVRGEEVTTIHARWRDGTVRSQSPTFMTMIDAMQAAADQVLGGPDNIRILFAFDS